MPTNAKILIIEDQPEWSAHLKSRYLELLKSSAGLDEVRVHIAGTAREALKFVDSAEATLRPYDFISLDIDLGPGDDGEQAVDGIRILETIRRRGAAWMVAVLTGAETDKRLNDNLTEKRANFIRRNLRSKLVATFPPERLLIVEKPSELVNVPADMLSSAISESTVLEGRLSQMVQVFSHTTEYRNLFRQRQAVLTVVKPGKNANRDDLSEQDLRELPAWKTRKTKMKAHWEIRFDCGEIFTVDGVAGYEVIQVLLTNERKEFSPGEILAMAAGESAPAEKSLFDQIDPGDANSGRLANEAAGMQDENEDGGEYEAPEFSAARELISGKKGSIQSENWDSTAADTVNSLKLLLGRKKARRTELNNPRQTLTSAEARELKYLEADIKELEKEIKGGSRGAESDASGPIRTAKARVLDDLRSEGFLDLAQHLDDYLIKLNGRWCYWPPIDMSWQGQS